jgi:hypothetical protein
LCLSKRPPKYQKVEINIHIFPFGGFFAVTQNTAFGVMISKYKGGKFVLF